MSVMSRYIYIIILTLATCPAFGQHAAPPVLDTLVAEALERNPALQAADHRWAAAKYRRPQVTAFDDPIFSYTRWLSTPETRVGPQTNVFTLSQRIPYPGKRGLQGEMADQDALASEAQYQATERDIAFQVKRAYYDLYRVDRSLQILDDYLNILRTFTSVAEEKYATGTGNQVNVLKSQVEISGILERRLGFERSRPGIVARINALRNRSTGDPVGPVTLVDTTRYVAAESLIVQGALTVRQELHEVDARIRKSTLMTAFSERAFRPDFNIQAAYITIPKRASLMSDAGKDAFSIMIGLNIPLMRGRRHAAVDEAKATRLSHEMMRTQLQNTIQSEITDAYMKMQYTARALDLYEQGLLLQAESSLTAALAAYQTDRLDFLSLLDAERMLLQVRLGYINERANYRQHLAALEWAAGGRLPEDL